ncbi:MAG: LamG-like jellyroll fold domain-containing protein [Planctomycetota bacterium]
MLDADVWDGTAATAMDFGTSDFSFSYWAYDDLASDGDARGVRAFDNLGAGLTEGIQLATTTTNNYNLRIDDDNGGSVISNNSTTITAPTDQWYHLVVNVDRGNGLVTVYINGASAGSYSIASLTGGIGPSQDLRIGAINFGVTAGEAQNQGLDDLAFYDGAPERRPRSPAWPPEP